MTKEEIRERLRDTRAYIERFLYIRTKDGRQQRFTLNAAQKRMLETVERQRAAGKPVRIIILKARQMGFSTLTEALIFHMAATRRYITAFIVAHRADSTTNLFRMSKLFLDNLPRALHPLTKASNAQEILFENPDKNQKRRAENPGLMSRIRCQTAGGSGIGRSDTIQALHMSEYAFWPGDKHETYIGLMQAVPSEPGTLVVIESTANGFDDFKTLWDAAVAGGNDFEPLFFPWFEFAEYRKEPEPGFERTEEERELAERYGLDDGQLAWRRWCIKNNCGSDRDKFRQEYPACPEEAFITTGRPVFDNDAIIHRIQTAPEPITVGEFTFGKNPDIPSSIHDITWTERENGCIKLYELPVPGRPYVIGGDTAGTGSDWFTGQVLDNVTGRQVAVLRHQYDEDQYTEQIFCLGRYYNDALIGIEVNYSTYPVKLLERMHYPRQYVRELPDTYTGALKKAFGWNTTSRTRPAGIAELVKTARDDPEWIRDRDTLREMLVFVYNDDHRPEAMEGEHDDLVMALMIAGAIRSQQDAASTTPWALMRDWTRDMIEDYGRATEEDRARMLDMWGKKNG